MIPPSPSSTSLNQPDVILLEDTSCSLTQPFTPPPSPPKTTLNITGSPITTSNTATTTSNGGGGPVRSKKGSVTVRKQNRLQRFVFTLPNPTEAEIAWLKNPEDWLKIPKWLIIGKEVCPTTGTPHLQGACILHSQVAFSSLKKWIGFSRAHLEPMKGSAEHSRVYCSKEDAEPFVYGIQPQSGGKSEALLEAIRAVEGGANMRDMALSGSHGEAIVKFDRGLSRYRSLRASHRDPGEPPCIMWISGATGTGKTRWAWEFCLNLYGLGGVWLCNTSNLQWFDGCDGHECAIFDDFRAKGVAFNQLLRVCDRYPLQCPVKGGFITWCPKLIIFTTPHNVEKTFATRNEHQPEDIRQLQRRITGGSYHLPDDQPYLDDLLLRSIRVPKNPDQLLKDIQMEKGILPTIPLVPVLSQSGESDTTPLDELDDSVWDGRWSCNNSFPTSSP